MSGLLPAMMVTSQRNTTTNWVREENHRDTPTSRPLYALLYVCSPTTELSFRTLSPLSKIPESYKYAEREMNVTFLKSILLSPHWSGWLMCVWYSASNDGQITKEHGNKLSQRRESSRYTDISATFMPYATFAHQQPNVILPPHLEDRLLFSKHKQVTLWKHSKHPR